MEIQQELQVSHWSLQHKLPFSHWSFQHKLPFSHWSLQFSHWSLQHNFWRLCVRFSWLCVRFLCLRFHLPTIRRWQPALGSRAVNNFDRRHHREANQAWMMACSHCSNPASCSMIETSLCFLAASSAEVSSDALQWCRPFQESFHFECLFSVPPHSPRAVSSVHILHMWKS